MSIPRRILLTLAIIVLVSATLLRPRHMVACPNEATTDAANRSSFFDDGDEDDKDKDEDVKKKPSKKEKPAKKPAIRWGQRRGESVEKYDKRYERVMHKIKQDKRGDFNAGMINNGKEQVRMWTYMGYPFIVRTDISKEFTADTLMYMEMLHREYGAAYKKILGVKSDLKEPVEVIVFADRDTYMKNGGTPGSGGFFNPAVHLNGDRGPHWPARHYRLQQFTDGIKDFSKWHKGVLKHEAAHMELQLRLGYKVLPGYEIGFPVDCPRWFNEGHASVFEYWDFDKTVDENLAEIPNRGRYAPVIRRLFETDRWKDFHYVWTIDPQTWHHDMTSDQGFFNYAQAWSLCAYMMNGGKKGAADFRKIFDLSTRVGVDRQTTYHGDRMRSWDEVFDDKEREKLEKNWLGWVGENVSRKKKVPDEDYFLRRMGYDPTIKEKLVRYKKEDDIKANRDWVEKEKKKRETGSKIEK